MSNGGYMKKCLSIFLSFIILIGTVSGIDYSAFAQEVTTSGNCGDYINWYYDDLGFLILSGDGEMYDYDTYNDVPWHSFAGQISGVQIDNQITSISAYAFYNCRNLNSIEIPETVERIGKDAFRNCKNLKNVYLNNLWNWTQVEFYGYASIPFYNGANLYLDNELVTTLVIPEGVDKINDYLFYNCISLESVIIPNSVTSIGYQSFYECENLKNVLIPNSVSKIGKHAFSFCTSLMSVEIPDSVTNLESYAFRSCRNLKNVTISNSLTELSDYTFYDCTNLTSIEIPNSATIVGRGVFGNCTNLERIVIPSSVTLIDGDAFFSCNNVKDVYYLGSKDDWERVEKKSHFSDEAIIHYFRINILEKPTCTTSGTCTYVSETCPEVFNGKVPAKGHISLVDSYLTPTCVTKGLTEGSHCSVCGKIIEPQQEIPATGHRIIIDATVSATCISTGLTEGSHCSVCGEVFVEQESIPMIPHKYISSLVQAAADSQGYTKYICSVCGDTYNADYFDAATVYSDIAGAKAGEIVKVPVYIRDNNGLMGWKLTFDYDSDVLTPISVENGEIINNGYLDDNIDGNMTPGSINVYWAGDDNNADNGIMFYINFVVNEDAVGKTNVDISFSKNDTFDVEYNDVYLNCEPVMLNVENDKYAQSAKITAGCDNITAGDDLELKLNISELQNVSAANITISYESNVFDFKSVNSISGIVTENIIPNGKIILDVSGISENADNKNFVTVLFKCKDNAASGDYDFNVTANETGIICKGCTVSVSPSATSELVKVYADDVNAKAGDTITIPIMIDNNHGIMGYGLNFTYDTNMLEIVSATRGTAFSGNFNDSIGVDDGGFIVLWNGTEDNLTNGVLLNLTFRILSNEITDAVINMTYSQDDTFNENWEDVVFDCKSINVKLNSHQHNYTEDVTSPTCTKKGYTTYTCSCGDSYVDDYVDAVGHSFGEYVSNNDATYESNGTKTAVCSRCGAKDTVVDEGSKLVKEPDLSSFVIKTVSLTLQSSIKMNFKVLKSALADFENPYMVFKCEGLADMIVTEYIEQGDYYVFSFPGISPKMMNNKVTAQLYGTYKENGEVYSSETKSISIKEYAYKMLDAYASINTAQAKKLKTLIVDLLNYGAQAQIYTNYKKNNLVNADLTDAQKAWGTASTPVLTNITDKEYKTISNPTAQWNAAGLVLNDSVKLRAKFTVDTIDNVTVKITCAGNTYTYGKDDFTKNSDGSYYVYCNEIKANQMSEEILMTVYDNGVQCSNTMRFSVESYAKGIQDSAYAGTALDNLTQAMMRYGKSAQAYGK